MAAQYATARTSRPRNRQEFAGSSGAESRQRSSSFQSQETPLVVQRRDITFADVGPGRVQIAITVTNTGPGRTGWVPALIQAAPFGAFVDWQMLTLIPVPPLGPGESTVLSTEAERVASNPLGLPDRVSPGRLLTALGLSDQKRATPVAASGGPKRPEPRSQARAAEATGKRLARELSSAGPGTTITRAISQLAETPLQPRKLPASPFDLLTGPDTYWAGNLNVFIGETDVERHMAKALRIVPGRTNAAMFIVGDGNGPEWYRFDLVGLGRDWEGGIFDPIHAVTLARGAREGMPIEPGTWTMLRRRSMLLLALKPPPVCDLGNVEVHVTQRSTQKTAVVEFSFDPRTAGPGCYLVE